MYVNIDAVFMLAYVKVICLYEIMRWGFYSCFEVAWNWRITDADLSYIARLDGYIYKVIYASFMQIWICIHGVFDAESNLV